MRKHVDVQTASQMFSLDLPELGPYTLDFARNGRHMLLGGQRGHVAVIDNLRMEVVQELHLREAVRDVQVRARKEGEKEKSKRTRRSAGRSLVGKETTCQMGGRGCLLFSIVVTRRSPTQPFIHDTLFLRTYSPPPPPEQFLHNEGMFAVAQKKYTYIYDNQGLELHCLRQHIDPMRLEFLPYHFLLASVGRYVPFMRGANFLFCLSTPHPPTPTSSSHHIIPPIRSQRRLAQVARRVDGAARGGALHQEGPLPRAAPEPAQRRAPPRPRQRWVSGPHVCGLDCLNGLMDPGAIDRPTPSLPPFFPLDRRGDALEPHHGPAPRLHALPPRARHGPRHGRAGQVHGERGHGRRREAVGPADVPAAALLPVHRPARQPRHLPAGPPRRGVRRPRDRVEGRAGDGGAVPVPPPRPAGQRRGRGALPPLRGRAGRGAQGGLRLHG